MKFLVFVADDFLHAFLMNRVQESPKQGDDEAAGPSMDKLADLLTDVFLIQRANDAAARVHAFLDASDQIPRNERIGLVLSCEVAAFLDARAFDPLRTPADQRS